MSPTATPGRPRPGPGRARPASARRSGHRRTPPRARAGPGWATGADDTRPRAAGIAGAPPDPEEDPMAVTDTLGRVGAYAAPIFEDDDVRRAARRAVGNARAAATARKEPPAGRLQRAGEAVRQAGQAITNLGSARERRREEL